MLDCYFFLDIGACDLIASTRLLIVVVVVSCNEDCVRERENVSLMVLAFFVVS